MLITSQYDRQLCVDAADPDSFMPGSHETHTDAYIVQTLTCKGEKQTPQ